MVINSLKNDGCAYFSYFTDLDRQVKISIWRYSLSPKNLSLVTYPDPAPYLHYIAVEKLVLPNPVLNTLQLTVFILGITVGWVIYAKVLKAK